MLRYLAALLFAVAGLFSTGAEAACTGQFPANTLCGNPTGSTAIPNPIPFSAVSTLTVGTTPISGATNGYVLYNNGGVLGAEAGGGGGGGVSTVSVVSANGFAGTVASPTTTPAITLSTSITGILQGNGTAISAATAGTDYLAPTGNGSGLTGLVWSQIGSTPTTIAGYGIANPLAYVVGSLVIGNCVQAASANSIVDAGAICGSGGGGGSSVAHTVDFLSGVNFTAGSTTSLTLPTVPNSSPALSITFDGVNQSGSGIAWTVNLSTGVITFTNPIPLGVAVVEARYLSTSLAAAGTVTSIGYADASSNPIYGITGTPVTTSGVISQTLLTQAANDVFAGPVSGGAAQPTFRLLVGADLPAPGASSLGGVKSLTATTHQFLTSITTAGLPVAAQPTYTDLAAGAPTATASALGLMKPDTSTTGTLSISAGVVSCTTMTSSQIGCAKIDGTTIIISGGAISAVGSALTVGSPISGSCTSGYVVYSNSGNVGCELLAGGGNVSNSGTPTIGQLAIWTNATTVQGLTALPAANVPAFTGDMTTTAGSLTTAVGKIGGNAVALGGAFTMSGAFTFTGTVTANTTVTFPTSGTLVNSAVATLSSLTSIGTIGTGTWQGTVVGATYGGTGVNNGSSTITLGGSLTTTGAYASTFAMSGAYTYTMPGAAANIAALNITSQALTGGFLVTSVSLGTFSSGTKTVNCGTSPQQYATNGGSFTLAAPAADSNCLVQLTNNGSAGSITFSGFSVGANTGDALDTTNGHTFVISVFRINGISGYRVAAAQ